MCLSVCLPVSSCLVRRIHRPHRSLASALLHRERRFPGAADTFISPESRNPWGRFHWCLKRLLPAFATAVTVRWPACLLALPHRAYAIARSLHPSVPLSLVCSCPSPSTTDSFLSSTPRPPHHTLLTTPSSPSFHLSCLRLTGGFARRLLIKLLLHFLPRSVIIFSLLLNLSPVVWISPSSFASSWTSA